MYKRQFTTEFFPTDSSTNVVAASEQARLAAMIERQSGYHPWKLRLPEEAVLSPVVRELLGLPADPAPASLRTLLDCIHPQDRSRFAAAVSEATEYRRGFRGTFRTLGPSDTVRTIYAVAEFGLDKLGHPTLQGIIKDSTAESRSQAISISRSRLLRNIVGGMPCPVVILDRNMNVLDCSTTWLRSHRMLDRSDATGQNYYSLFPDTPAESRGEYDLALTGVPIQTTRRFINPRTGNKIECMCMINPWDASEDGIGGIVILVGWSEFGVANAARRSHVVADFGGSLLEMLEQESRAADGNLPIDKSV